MAHFAQMDGNKVINVIVVNDDDCGGGVFPKSEPIGQQFIKSIGLDGDFLQTSYNNNFRGRYAVIGATYDPALDEFISPISPQTEDTTNE